MKLVCARSADHVIDIAGGLAELRRETVGYRLHFAHVTIGDGKQAQAVTVGLRIDCAVELIADAVWKTVGVELARDAQFRIRVAANARLEEDEVIGIA